MGRALQKSPRNQSIEYPVGYLFPTQFHQGQHHHRASRTSLPMGVFAGKEVALETHLGWCKPRLINPLEQ